MFDLISKFHVNRINTFGFMEGGGGVEAPTPPPPPPGPGTPKKPRPNGVNLPQIDWDLQMALGSDNLSNTFCELIND